MKKLKLDLDQIQVFSLAVSTTDRGKGTVNALSTTFNTVELMQCVGTNESCGSCPPNICLLMPE